MAKNQNEIIEGWFQTLIHGTIIQRDGDLYNKFHDAKEELKKLLAPVENKKNPKEEII
jgi:hypothetical protein